ncbi:GDSL family lipase [Streptomyces katsurahamanus]|uniref:GDSL family lipase n=1 Tax=Streptomyces katsurahamanus TaxID=2577098 RepID=A0ABW9NUJ0_9ACTN|nr:GDSL family lipase [Streptomyces katsurahamanus]
MIRSAARCRGPPISPHPPVEALVTWLDPHPFLHGVAWLDEGRPVRADPADRGRLPRDTWDRAVLPTGVRLEFTAGGARAVRLRYRAAMTGPDLLPDCFALWQSDRCLSETFAEPAAEAAVTIPLPTGARGRFTVYLPEPRAPVVLGLRAVGGPVAPAPARPRWLVHGDSITEGWWSTRPARSWPATAGRRLALDTVNLGYAGTAHGELAIAEQLAALPADVLTLAFGTNCWSKVPCSPPLLYETVRAFLTVVRQGHPGVPLLMVSPVLRPAAEHAPNRLGATLAELRAALERAVAERAREDSLLALLPGRDVLGPGQLADGIHPDDEGHALLADAVTGALSPLLERSGGGPPRLIRPRADPRAAAW